MPEKWALQLPVSLEWELDDELMPTGRLLPADPSLARGINLKGKQIEKLFLIGDRPHMAILAQKGYEVRIETSDCTLRPGETVNLTVKIEIRSLN
jgi:aldose 1-epimerase